MDADLELNDKELISFALNQWANIVETGTPTLSARDAAQQKKSYAALTEDQMELVLRLRRLARKQKG